MSDTLRTRWWQAALLTVCVGVTGCGVPDSGPPVVQESMPQSGIGVERYEEPTAVPQPTDANTPEEAVELYFHAATGDWEVLEDQVSQFMTTDGRAQWQPSETATIVRVDQQPQRLSSSPEDVSVRVTGQVVGEYTRTGQVIAQPPSEFFYEFHLRLESTRTGVAWRITNPPRGYLLSVRAMENDDYFEPMPLYFAGRGRDILVPDTRYMPQTLEYAKRRSLLVEWLLDGPSPWLANVVDSRFPTETQLVGNVVLDDHTVIVNLSSEAQTAERYDLLYAQLVWTLRPLIPESLEIRIGNRAVTVHEESRQRPADYLEMNAAHREPMNGYFVNADGSVEPEAEDGILPNVLRLPSEEGEAINTSVVSAALDLGLTNAALVRDTGEGPRLWIGNASHTLNPEEGVASYREVDLSAWNPQRLGRPIWVRGPADKRAVLLLVDGHLTVVDAATTQAQRVSIPSLDGRIDAFSVAPDGFRLALVADGQIYRASLQQGAELVVGDPELVTHLITDATDVAWSRQDNLVISGVYAGVNGPIAGIWEITIDGVFPKPVPVSARRVPQGLASWTDNPNASSVRGAVLFEQDGQIYEAHSADVTGPGGRPTPVEGTNPFFPT